MEYSDDYIPGAAAPAQPPAPAAQPPIEKLLGRLGAAGPAPRRVDVPAYTDDEPEADTPGEQPAQLDPTPPAPGSTFALEAPARDDDWGGDTQTFAAVAPTLGVNQDQAQKLLDLVAEQTPGITSDMLDRDPRDGTILGWKEDNVRAHLRGTWGAEYEQNLVAVDKAVKARGQAFADWLDATGAGNNPAVLQLLAAVGRNPDLMNPAKAGTFIDKTMNDRKHPYWQGNKQAVFEMRLAHQFAQEDTMSSADRLAQTMRHALGQ